MKGLRYLNAGRSHFSGVRFSFDPHPRVGDDTDGVSWGSASTLFLLFSFLCPNGISSDRIVTRGSNPSSDRSLPPPFAARSREGGRAWNEFLTNHRGNRQH